MNLSNPEWVLAEVGVWHYYETDVESVCGVPMPLGKSFSILEEPFDTTCAKCSRIAQERSCLRPLSRKIIEYIQDKCVTQEDLNITSREILAMSRSGLLLDDELRLISEAGRRRRKELQKIQDEQDNENHA